jgi:hypothetical protein
MAFACRALGGRGLGPIALLLLAGVAASCSDRPATGMPATVDARPTTGGSGPSTGGAGGGWTGGRGGQGGTSGAGGSVVAGSGGTGGEGPLNEGSRPGPQPLYRLNDLEYANTVRDLLGEALDTEAPLLPTRDHWASGTRIPVGNTIVSGRDLDALVENAELLAARAVSRMPQLLPPSCASVAGGAADAGATAGSDAEETCVRRFIEQFGTRAYRRPLEEVEQLELLALYQKIRSSDLGGSFQDGVRVLTGAFLQSPHFLYRWESTGFPRPPGSAQVPPEGTLVQLNGFEVASRLSYFLWSSMPDQRLFEAAAAGTLLRPGRIAEEARRMLADQKARDGLGAFHRAWLGVEPERLADKDPSFTKFTPELARLMVQETGEFAAGLLLGAQGDGKLTTLLTARSWARDPALAAFYGAGPRAGLFTLGAFLATHADRQFEHPIQRGVVAVGALICQEVPPPPELILPPLPEPSPGVTTRQRYEGFIRDNGPVCVPCHRLFNGAGFAFSHYDAVGAFRTTENGAPIDASGELDLSNGQTTLRFKDAVELMQGLAPRPEVQVCVTRHWARWLLRRLELPSEEPALAAALERAGRQNTDIRELLVALTRTRLFTHRALSRGEPLR